jgi:dTDP-4-dehydrorhamnose 3,5-epimerase
VERIDLSIPEACVLRPKVFNDARGFFMETYNQATMSRLGLDFKFVQDNHSRSVRGAIRGMQYQLKHPQGKLCRVVVGEVLDVILDVRTGSPMFGQWVSVLLSAENKQQIWVPPGCAHGFSVLSESAEFLYKVTDFYHPEDEQGLLATDPKVGIDWQVSQPLLSPRDLSYPPLSEKVPDLLPKF